MLWPPKVLIHQERMSLEYRLKMGLSSLCGHPRPTVLHIDPHAHLVDDVVELKSHVHLCHFSLFLSTNLNPMISVVIGVIMIVKLTLFTGGLAMANGTTQQSSSSNSSIRFLSSPLCIGQKRREDPNLCSEISVRAHAYYHLIMA